jgi:hypothetical protein
VPDTRLHGALSAEHEGRQRGTMYDTVGQIDSARMVSVPRFC